MLLLAAALAHAVSLISTAPAQAGGCEDGIARVQKAFRKALSGAHATLKIGRGDRLWLDEKLGPGVSTDSPFLLASVTKPLTSVITLRLASRGILSLEDPVASELPSSYDTSRDSRWKQVRLRQLLAHSSGVPDYINGHSGSSTLEHPTAYADLLDLAGTKLVFAPDSQGGYSNTDFLIVAQFAAQKARDSYRGLFDRELLSPLGLRHTRLVYQPGDYFGGTGVHVANMEGVGNGVSTTADLYAFLQALDGTELLAQKWVNRMLSLDPACKPGPKCDRYGLGFVLRFKELEGHDWALHTGHLKSVANVIAKIRDLGVNLVLLSDASTDFDTEAFAKAQLSTLLQAGCAG
jgi:CubicO group peptidase (beta-lactamase class C family)